MERLKHCSQCKEELPESKFHKDRRNPDGRKCYCKSCQKTYRPNHEVQRGRYLKHKFGFTLADYTQMLESQDGKCAICGTTDPQGKGVFTVDHNHLTGEVRGLLCNGCNTGIGLLGDSVANLSAAITYLSTRGSYGA